MKAESFTAYARGKKTSTAALLFATVAVLMVGALRPAHVNAQQPNRVGLVVDFGDHYETYCVEFNETEITGYDVLHRAGLNLMVSGSGGMGFAVCDINDTSGCSPSNCFCRCQGSPCTYWSYHHLEDGSWQYSQTGASNYRVQDGDVEGWGWGEGVINSSGAQPPAIPFDQICAPEATDTPDPTNTPVPPTETPVPTNTPVPPTNTPTPTPVPTPEVWFRLDRNPIPAGSCTMLRWDTSHAQEVHLDGERVDVIGRREVCPEDATDYELRVVELEEEETYRLTLGVTGAGPTPTATSQSTTRTPSPSSTSNMETETPLPESPTPEETESPPPSPTPMSSPTQEPVASPSPTPMVSTSPTAAQVAETDASPTPAQLAEADDTERAAPEEQPSASVEDESSSALVPIGYITFSLIAGGLVGWLIYALRSRGEHA